jgi:uncharacterized protein with FMN-binding domain
MVERQPPAYWALVGLSLLFSILAVVTLLPSPGASKPNVLGYHSVCSFAPAATALCGLLAGITCTIRNRFVSARRSSTRYQPPFAPAGVGLLLVALAAVSGGAFARAQARFTAVVGARSVEGRSFGAAADGVRRATVSEGEVSATVEATVASGRVVKLVLVESRNVEASVAEAILAAVTGAQSTAVDAVSGATASSQVLLAAIEAAVSEGR